MLVASRNNIADALSHLTKIPASPGYIQDKEYVRKVTLQVVPVALRIEEIEEASTQDEDLKVVRACLQSGDWSKVPKDFALIAGAPFSFPFHAFSHSPYPFYACQAG